MSGSDPHHSAAAIWRIESPRLIAALMRLVQSVDVAEDLAQGALLEALECWSNTGVPERPGAWLMTAARHRAVDWLRHTRRVARKHDQLKQESVAWVEPGFEDAPDDIVRDDLLRLVFTACHPVLSPEARVALTLRLLGGLTTAEIARAFLMRESSIAQRITRAKTALSSADVGFELPRPEDLTARLDSVLEVIYLVFNEGYLATAGDDWMRPALCEDALRLGRMLVELLPGQSEAQGLLALMELQASRTHARVGPDGEAVLLLDQDRRKWDALLVRRGLEALARADAIAPEQPGPYQLQAAIAACHARAREAADTDWHRITRLYGILARVAPSPIVELNRAVATGMAIGPEAALAIVKPLLDDPALARYPFLPSVHADCLAKVGRFAEAQLEVEHAADLTDNARERRLLLERAAAYARAQTASRD